MRINIFLCFFLSISVYALPDYIEASLSLKDPWSIYKRRPSITFAEKHNLYSSDIIYKSKTSKMKKGDHIPWTFKEIPEGDNSLFSLGSVVADRTNDKKHILMYHGTTSDFLDTFMAGEGALRFDKAHNKQLGMGFYLTANLNEAKFYACRRLKERISHGDTTQGLKAMILVVGIEDTPTILGKTSSKFSPLFNKYLSKDKTGEPLDPNIFFLRNREKYNQFNFFSNIAPFLKLFKVVILPNNFAISKEVNDFDGLSVYDATPESDPAFRCSI